MYKCIPTVGGQLPQNPEFGTNTPELRASDEQISEFVSLLDAFPYISHSDDPGPNEWRLGSGLIVSDILKCAIWQAKSYRKVVFLRASNEEPGLLFNMDRFLGELNSIGSAVGVRLSDSDKNTLYNSGLQAEDAFERLKHEYRRDELIQQLAQLGIAHAAVKPNDVLSLQQADEFNQRNPYFAFFNGMAVTDVLLREYESGFPIFYGIIPRPSAVDIEKLVTCFTQGEIRTDKNGGTPDEYFELMGSV